MPIDHYVTNVTLVKNNNNNCVDLEPSGGCDLIKLFTVYVPPDTYLFKHHYRKEEC